jgi:hypothetical protein
MFDPAQTVCNDQTLNNISKTDRNGVLLHLTHKQPTVTLHLRPNLQPSHPCGYGRHTKKQFYSRIHPPGRAFKVLLDFALRAIDGRAKSYHCPSPLITRDLLLACLIAGLPISRESLLTSLHLAQVSAIEIRGESPRETVILRNSRRSQKSVNRDNPPKVRAMYRQAQPEICDHTRAVHRPFLHKMISRQRFQNVLEASPSDFQMKESPPEFSFFPIRACPLLKS